MRTLTAPPPEFGCLGDLANPIADSEIQSALNRKVSQIGRMVLPGVSLFLFLAAAFDHINTTGDISGSVPAATWGSAAIALSIGLAFKQGFIPARFANAAVSAAMGAVLLQSVVRIWVSSPALPTIHILVLIVGASSILLSWRWLAITVGGSVGLWALSAWLALPASDQGYMTTVGCAMGIDVIVAAVIHHQRLLAYRNRFRDEIIEAQNKETLRQVQSRYESAVRGANDGLWFWDLEAERVYCSARWAQMVGCSDEAISLSPQAWWDTVDPYYLDALRSAFQSHLGGESAQLEYKHRVRKQDGSYIWVLTRGLATRDEGGIPKSIAGSMTDISHAIEIEQRLVHDALQDKLTGLANRHCLMTELQLAVEESRETGKLIALIFLDLDDFKLVNDNLGHPVGDQLLAEAAKTLWTCTRPGDTLARYGGDEFVLLLDGIEDLAEAEGVGRRMQQVLSAPMEVSGHRLKLTASVGIAINNPAVRQHDELLRNADIAMYRAKAEGEGRLRVFNSEMHGQARRSWELYNVVRGVVDREECLLRYQPIVSLDNGRVTGAEALFRWQAPDDVQRPTIELILAAERTGSIIGIGDWVLRKACADAVDWQRRGLPPVRISANVSAHQLRLPGFAELVEDIVRTSGLDPHWLELELTETAFMQDIETVCANLRALVDLGVALAVDDFGTGYSSLSYLAKFPLNTLKIDGSFVSGIGVDPQTAALTKGVISLAHSLGLSVTAEKVETIQQLRFLAAEGCDRIQGYLSSPPLTAESMAEVLESNEFLLPCTKIEPITSQRSVELESLRQAVGM